MHAIRSNDIVTHVRVDGPENAPTIVFANSLGTDFRAWDGVVDRLSPPFRCVRYDMRGHGLSTPTPGPYSIDQLTDDLIRVLDELAPKPTVVCGLSVGGMIAQRLAARDPDRVKALILCDTGLKLGDDDLWNTRIAAVHDAGLEPIADAIMERWFADSYQAVDPDTWRLARNMVIRTPVEGYAGVCAALRDGELTQGAARINVPTLVIGGSEDAATPPDLVRALAASIEGARFELIDGVGHLPCIEAPGILAGLIETFLSETTGG